MVHGNLWSHQRVTYIARLEMEMSNLRWMRLKKNVFFFGKSSQKFMSSAQEMLI